MLPENPNPEIPKKYPLDVEIQQPELIYNQALTVNSQAGKFGKIITIGKIDPVTNDFFSSIFTEIRVAGPRKKTEDTEGCYFPTCRLQTPNRAIDFEQGEEIASKLNQAGYQGLIHQRNISLINSEPDGTHRIIFRAGEYQINLDLGFLGANEAVEVWQRRIDSFKESPGFAPDIKTDDLNPEQKRILEGVKEDINSMVGNVYNYMKDPLGNNYIQFSINSIWKQYSPNLAFTTPQEFEKSLKMLAKVTQEVHAIINEVTGVNPSPKKLTIKPEVLNTDVRIAREIAEIDIPVTKEQAIPVETGFEQIAGYPEEVENLKDIAYMLEKQDSSAPKGILLYGPPGTGKTIMAKAFGVECKDFATFTPLEMGSVFTAYIHESANRLRAFLVEAQKRTYSEDKKLAIIFLDELDAVATSVQNYDMDDPSTKDRREVRKVLLEWLDGIRSIKNPWDTIPVFMIGATNFKQVMDEALIRSGRIDEHIFLGEPSSDGLIEILKLKASQADYLDPVIRWEDLSSHLEGVSGADVETLFKKAYRKAVIRAKRIGTEPRKVTLEDLIQIAPTIIEERNRRKEEIKEKIKPQMGLGINRESN